MKLWEVQEEVIKKSTSARAGDKEIRKAEGRTRTAERERDQAIQRRESEVSDLHRQLQKKDKSYEGQLELLGEQLANAVARGEQLDEKLKNFRRKATSSFREKRLETERLDKKEITELREALETSSGQDTIQEELNDVIIQFEEQIRIQNLENDNKQKLISELKGSNTDLEQKILELEGIINEKDRRRANLLDAVGRLATYLANNVQPKKVNSFW